MIRRPGPHPRSRISFGSIETRVAGVQRIEEQGEVADRERAFEQRGVAEAREALVELYDLLEEYAPKWYTESHHARALAAIKALQES